MAASAIWNAIDEYLFLDLPSSQNMISLRTVEQRLFIHTYLGHLSWVMRETAASLTMACRTTPISNISAPKTVRFLWRPLEEVVLQWLGERVFSSRLAQMIVCHAPANTTPGDLDVSRIRPLSSLGSTDPKNISCGCFSRRSRFLTQNDYSTLPLAEARSGKKIRIARESQHSELTALP